MANVNDKPSKEPPKLFKEHPEGKRPGENAQPDPEVQKVVDRETEQGFRGVEVDPTPNENYTVDGVVAGAPTPETDKQHAESVRAHLLGVDEQAEGVAKRR